LLRNFGSIERIARASVEELTPYVGLKTARLVAEHFERQRNLAGK
jgi:excinuclease UvrABC nuclease subunit